MDRVFSVDDIADQFWSPPPAVRLSDEEEMTTTSSSSSQAMMMMNRSSSEWAFERFLQEAQAKTNASDVVEIKDVQPPIPINPAAAAAPPPNNIPVDSEEYQAFLKTRLDLACAAVALTRVRFFLGHVLIFFLVNLVKPSAWLCFPFLSVFSFRSLCLNCWIVEALFFFLFLKLDIGQAACAQLE